MERLGVLRSWKKRVVVVEKGKKDFEREWSWNIKIEWIWDLNR